MNQFTKLDDVVEQFEPKDFTQNKEQQGRSNHWEVRTEERPYALLSDTETKKENRYGQRIDLLDITDGPKDRSMFINENPEVGCNPNRNKQHGFFFTADNCIGCHACEAACSEKNENPAHIAFRSVGYVEGGSYPAYKRLNISMACNHCDDPVCLKGCPTRAYTKHAEYGAVLQDPETCFGCGYCTWVCPYNAPQLDPVQGQVSKCNMCVDRLEVGLKPACVSACVGNALDFGVIENTPENRDQCKTSIPGFPSPEITQPNIRFQQTKSLPDEMTRTDSAPVKYSKDADGEFRPVVDQKQGKAKQWNLAKLSSRENPLVLFTLLAQAALGFFSIPVIAALSGIDGFSQFLQSDGFILLPILATALMGIALIMSITHLGKPIRFYRGFNNLRFSPMAREGFGLTLFSIGTGLTVVASALGNQTILTFLGKWLPAALVPSTKLAVMPVIGSASLFAIVAGFAGLYYMNKCYQIKARPFWHHWQTATAFVGNTFALGSLLAGLLILPTLMISAAPVAALSHVTLVLSILFTFGIAIEAIGLIAHNKKLNMSNNEGGAAHYVQSTTFGKTYLFRNGLLALNIIAAISLLTYQAISNNAFELSLYWLALAILNIGCTLISRALFYVLVIPTTMPGAFFWRNKGFEQHARDIGLADNPATGIAPQGH